ncbi:hypothetical protein AAFF_G00373650 [Aldrovandia affinis]|uniref:Uncharacterized protein n=1 Tax=Aldrovandia affinis TaxID=143900 RepID=A0AAD7SGN6_9TELE|nr:hypothetical protein AAFF_G00373650 [Aldrovandia affinis]
MPLVVAEPGSPCPPVCAVRLGLTEGRPEMRLAWLRIAMDTTWVALKRAGSGMQGIDSCLDPCCSEPDALPTLNPPYSQGHPQESRGCSGGVKLRIKNSAYSWNRQDDDALPSSSLDMEAVTGSGSLDTRGTGCRDVLCVNIHVRAGGKVTHGGWGMTSLLRTTSPSSSFSLFTSP